MSIAVAMGSDLDVIAHEQIVGATIYALTSAEMYSQLRTVPYYLVNLRNHHSRKLVSLTCPIFMASLAWTQRSHASLGSAGHNVTFKDWG